MLIRKRFEQKAVGEIANQMSGYARRHFGQTMDISPPRILTKPGDLTDVAPGAVPFVIPLMWERYEANLVVRMTSV